MKVGIIDYGAGNVRSVQNALDRLGVAYVLSSDADVLDSCDRIIFPGVGAAGAAMEELNKRMGIRNREKGNEEQLSLASWIQQCEKPFLGICLGMQLLCDRSEEGDTECLSIIPGTVRKFDQKKCSKIPHMGWNEISWQSGERAREQDEYFYFVHSYFVPVGDSTLATCQYEGGEFSALVRRENFWGMQFHPEKSGKVGEQVLLRFLNTPSSSPSKREKN